MSFALRFHSGLLQRPAACRGNLQFTFHADILLLHFAAAAIVNFSLRKLLFYLEYNYAIFQFIKIIQGVKYSISKHLSNLLFFSSNKVVGEMKTSVRITHVIGIKAYPSTKTILFLFSFYSHVFSSQSE